MKKIEKVPFTVIAIADSQRINVFSYVDKSFSGKALCVKDQGSLNLQKLYSDLVNGKGKIITKTNNRFVLDVEEMVNVNTVDCMYVFNDNKYTVAKVNVVKNAFGLPLETSFSIKEIHSKSVAIDFTTSYPSLVWCSPSQTIPTISQLQNSKAQFIETKGIVTVTNLDPLTKYGIYCYAEGMNKVAMGRTVKSTLMSITTKDAPPPITTSATTSIPISFPDSTSEFATASNPSSFPDSTSNPSSLPDSTSEFATTSIPVSLPDSTSFPFIVTSSHNRKPLQIINLDLHQSSFNKYYSSVYYFLIIVLFVVICM